MRAVCTETIKYYTSKLCSFKCVRAYEANENKIFPKHANTKKHLKTDILDVAT